jgi:hypothetical protein
MYKVVKQLTKEHRMTTADLQTPARELTLQDRCDSCSAAAKVVATFLNGELLFCGHHARKMSDTLKVKAVNVYDPEGVTNTLN